MPVMLLDLNSGGEADRPMYANDMIITGSVFSNDASRMDIEQARASGTWDISDNSSIDFGVQMTEVKNRAVSNFTQLNAWGGISDPGEIADIVVRSTIDGQFDELSGSDYPGLQTEFFAADLPICRPPARLCSPQDGTTTLISVRVWLETAVHTIARHPPYGLMTNEPRKKHSPLTFA